MKVIENAHKGIGVTHYDSVDEMFRSILGEEEFKRSIVRQRFDRFKRLLANRRLKKRNKKTIKNMKQLKKFKTRVSQTQLTHPLV